MKRMGSGCLKHLMGAPDLQQPESGDAVIDGAVGGQPRHGQLAGFDQKHEGVGGTDPATGEGECGKLGFCHQFGGFLQQGGSGSGVTSSGSGATEPALQMATQGARRPVGLEGTESGLPGGGVASAEREKLAL